MQSNRLVRLVETVLKIKTQPHQTRQQCLASLSIGKSQFYYDLQSLNELGLSIKYSNHEKAFLIKKEPAFTIPDLALGDTVALMLAVRQQVLTARNDFALAYGAYAALCHIIAALPSKTRKELINMVDNLIVKDGFGCHKDILDKLQGALQDRNRIVIDCRKEGEKVLRRYTADPERLYFEQGSLFLDAFTPESKKTETFRVPLIKQVIKTPFFIPR
ncbi:MAG: WYL domain-containing protein [Thermodesulfobacteriota bacterium]|nr:WYL domain-containing protein [Thermodesulfobacteriota bacterium]